MQLVLGELNELKISLLIKIVKVELGSNQIARKIEIFFRTDQNLIVKYLHV